MKAKLAVIGQGGVYDGATAVAANRVYSPANRIPGITLPGDYGYKTWTYDPAESGTAGTIGASGTLHLAKVFNTQSLVINSVSLYGTVGGGSLTNVGVGIWNTGAAGAVRASSINANGATTAAFAIAGLLTVTFSSPPTVTADFYIGWWTTGTTQPTYLRGSNLGGVNVNLTVNNSRFATANTGLTTAAPSTLGTISQSAIAWWAAAA